MSSRRTFLRQLSTGGLLLSSGWLPLDAIAAGAATSLTILHTNDMHSRIDPFPDDDKRYAGRGGMSARAAIIQQIRDSEQHVLLLDSGDIFQGTPYFNYYGGAPELELMSAMQYDAATMGNHDFDNGLNGFAAQLPQASFPFLVANYDFSDTILHKEIQPYTTIKKGRLKIGVFGLGIELKGLVPDRMYGDTVYLDPITKAQETANLLRYDEKCDLVICLSHLGYSYKDNKISDKVLAASTSGIDLILGGHTHTFLDQPLSYKNCVGEEVLINQVGWGGVMLGRLNIIYDEVKRKNWRYTQPVIVSKKSRG